LSVRSKAAILLMMQERETAIEVKARLTRDQDAAVLALREALDKVSVYVLSATWPKDTPMEAHRQEIIGVIDRVLADHSAAADDIRERVERETRDGR
jgi:hypothetical protein